MTEPASKPTPPYFKYAVLNPYNLAVVGGLASTAVLTGNWWFGLLAGGVEAVWMLFAPESRLLRKVWFDKRHATEVELARRAELEKKFAQLPQGEAARCAKLMETKTQIDRLALENRALGSDLLGTELAKLDALVGSFIELSVDSARYQAYLATADPGQIESDLTRYRRVIEKTSDDEQRSLAQKNLAIVEQRKDRYREIRRDLSSALGQMELIENTFKLLADQIVTMRSPQEMGGQLDDLVDGVEAIKQTARDTDKLLQTIDR